MPIIMHNTSRRVGESYVAPPPTETPATPMSRYLTTLAPMARAKAESALLRFGRFDGVASPRHTFAERIASGGARYDASRKRLYHGAAGCFYDESAVTTTVIRYVLWLVNERG